jgi:hypothetical protein
MSGQIFFLTVPGELIIEGVEGNSLLWDGTAPGFIGGSYPGEEDRHVPV